jgi:hypothetical protein
MRRRWRSWLTLVFLLICTAATVRFYLSSRFITARIAARLEELYGGRIQVGGANVGLRQTRLFNVALFEAGDDARPWLTIDRLDTDLTLLQAIVGKAPSHIVLRGVTVTLRFDDEGRIQTELPSRRNNSAMNHSALPQVIASGGKVQLVGPGRRRLDFENVSATLNPGPENSIFDGKGFCPTCGHWKASGAIDAINDCASLTVRSQGDVAVTQSLLDALPFVPAATWREVQVDGSTPVTATLTYDGVTGRRNYQVDLQPQHATVHVAVIDLAASDVAGSVQIANDKVEMRDLKGRAYGGAMQVDGTVDFSQAVAVDLAKLAVDGWGVQDLPKLWCLPPQIAGKLHAACRLSCATGSGKIHMVGTGNGEIRDAQFGSLPITEPIRLALRDSNGATQLTVQGTLEPSKLGTIADVLGAKLPPEVSGQAALDATMSLPLDTIDDPASYHAQGIAHLTDARINKWSVPAAEIHWHCDAKRILVDSLQAEAYNGSIYGSASIPIKKGESASGKLFLSGLDLGQLLGPSGGEAVAGTVDAELDFKLDGEDYAPVAKGRVVINDVAWRDEPVASDVQGDVLLTRNELTVGNIAATVARGNLSGKLVANLKQPERSWFQLELDNAELTELLHPWPALAEHAQGILDARLRGTLGKDWNGNADLVLQRGKLLGIDVTEWRAPVRWAVHPGEGRWELEMRDSNAQVAQGRVTAQASAAWSSGMRLNSQVQFVGVNLHQAFPGTKLGTGRATGRLDLSSDRLQTIDDLQGNLTATMQHTQAMEYPVLRQVAPLLGLTTSKTFQSGEVRARLAKGVVHVEKLALTEGPVQLFAEGTVTLQGRVQLDMTATTGKLGNLTAGLGWRLPQTGTITSDLLARATAALSPQLVHLHVRGTVREPTVQVLPLPLLTEQALRFFAGVQ